MTMTIGPQKGSADRVRSSAGTLSPRALLGLLREYLERAGGVLSFPQPGQDGRSYDLLELTDDLEIWAIHWPRGEGLELHDHGGSAGALWVIEGVLEEHSLGPDLDLAQRTLTQGGGIAFGADYIHDVVNPCDAPATSVHAYSPPMESMTFYRIDDQVAARSSRLVADRTEYRADPAWCP